ncbi:putative transcription factor C3H family [Helianthus annuus]|uniref:Putative zinc finger, CCCH-type, Ankyrin repeat-containing domain protein n=1 Tax=Helianthus annuus TaxID=4232 RepID=A0A251UPB0_HELAN|nr:zinc finger CCCH domain-containing protein 29 [Helianthus annuus]KAF5805658.1 putative transcription factor C3H family [Helianthus annuus]KAJ0570054.1 putative transcription factor C3H family [Helianthus annuus]KAJ0576766.1 putative transcription factor C3H family [Helianthus annuus]KAJ0584384.1 putative transcription factor C3H family [Helianthus annuus]KAJ0747012.1 putative transcription factor C3H family [Helianthus annuus]
MEGEKFQQKKIIGLLKRSRLLELAAADDLSAFVSDAEEKGIGVDEFGFWYGRRNSSKLLMGFEERTPLMIASIYGSIRVLKFLIGSKKIDVNKPSGTDGATALHCAAAGGSVTSVDVVKMLIEAGADVNLTDGNGNKPGDLIARGIKSSIRKGLEMFLKGFVMEEAVAAKKEYPIDVPFPDINGELYGSDEFRMYTFKVKPCSRAYTHDWTECPFVHPGENARRRDPNKYNYSCVPCPEFRKGSCANGDACEYAHGVFESWLHPAQYKTRLCKDETSCGRKVCFFAHKVDELRPLYASTGSAIPSPKPGSASSTELGLMSPIQNSSPMVIGSTPPMSPSLSPVTGWQNKLNHLSPPVLQLSSSRLRTALNARDFELQNLRTQQQRQLMVDNLSSNLYTNRFGELNSSNLDNVSGYISSPIRKPTNFAFESSAAVAQAVVNSRSSAFSKQRSQSFINRSSAGAGAGAGSGAIGSPFSQWGSPDGKLEWGFNEEDANKFKKSASFVYRNDSRVNVDHQPDASWVGVGLYSSSEKQRYGGHGGGYGGGGGEEKLPQWMEQMLIEQERLVA